MLSIKPEALCLGGVSPLGPLWAGAEQAGFQSGPEVLARRDP